MAKDVAFPRNRVEASRWPTNPDLTSSLEWIPHGASDGLLAFLPAHCVGLDLW